MLAAILDYKQELQQLLLSLDRRILEEATKGQSIHLEIILKKLDES